MQLYEQLLVLHEAAMALPTSPPRMQVNTNYKNVTLLELYDMLLALCENNSAPE